MSTLVSTHLAQARQYFAVTKERIGESVSGLSDSQIRFKPATDCWSIAQILEHMAMVHDRILARLEKDFPQAPAPAADRDSGFIDSLVVEKIPDRSRKFKAPEFIQPAGLIPVAESLDRIASTYRALEEYLESTPDLRAHVMESAPLKAVTDGAYNTMDGYQWALAIAAHDERHVRQILEVKADPNFPA